MGKLKMNTETLLFLQVLKVFLFLSLAFTLYFIPFNSPCHIFMNFYLSLSSPLCTNFSHASDKMHHDENNSHETFSFFFIIHFLPDLPSTPFYGWQGNLLRRCELKFPLIYQCCHSRSFSNYRESH